MSSPKPSLNLSTRLVQGAWKGDPTTGAINPPVYLTSTYRQQAPGQHAGFEYSRTQHPTRQVLEQLIADVEGMTHGFAFASGMAAIDAVLRLRQPMKVVAISDLYGGTYRLFEQVYRPLGYSFYYADDTNALIELMHEVQPDLIWIETPTNPMLRLVDIQQVAQHKPAQVLLVVDNTFASPYLQQPAFLGADIVVHSATKYLGGHSDVVLGLVAVKDNKIAERLAFLQNATGAVPGPMDCYLVWRGMRTLHVRMERHCDNAEQVAEFLFHHPAVAETIYPGLPTHPHHQLARRQMRRFGGMVTFRLKQDTLQAAETFFRRLRVFALAESLGGVESLANHPAIMTHASIPETERQKLGITPGLIRLSVGIEDAEDLLADLAYALEPLVA